MTDCLYGGMVCWETFDQRKECDTCEFNINSESFEKRNPVTVTGFAKKDREMEDLRK